MLIRAVSIVVLTSLMLGSAGCSVSRLFKDDAALAERLESAPPVMLDQESGMHLLVVQAPNPGWSVRLDSTELTPEGKRVYITYRQPDPTLVYPQRIVLKRVLTRVPVDTNLDVAARVLKHDEKARKQSYGPIEPVGSLDQ